MARGAGAANSPTTATLAAWPTRRIARTRAAVCASRTSTAARGRRACALGGAAQAGSQACHPSRHRRGLTRADPEVHPQRLEARVLDIVARVEGGGRAEDDYVECKADWPEPAKAARRLAGHANAARGEPILWIMGLDEDAHACAALSRTDPSSWLDQVLSRFPDGLAPDASFLTVPVGEGRSVVAMECQTDRSPYVVTTSGRAEVDREVPWRAGTRIRSAHRHELLRLLVPAAAVPALELFDLVFTVQHRDADDGRYGDPSGPERLAMSLQANCSSKPPSRSCCRLTGGCARCRWARRCRCR